MEERKPLSKKTRFNVFKRDSFTCQYCGRMAPDVILEIDHINPIANGGDNNIINLVTSCFDCNRGKGKREISENEELKKQQTQLKELNTKREQLKMLVEWKKELLKFEEEQFEIINKMFFEKTKYSINENGKIKMLRYIKEFGINEVMESTQLSLDQYFNGTVESVGKSFDYVPKICNVRAKTKLNPWYHKAKQIIFMLKKRFTNFNESDSSVRIIHKIIVDDYSFEFVKQAVYESNNLYSFRSWLKDYANEGD